MEFIRLVPRNQRTGRSGSDRLCSNGMSLLSSQLVGRDRHILVVRLPAMVTDEQVAVIQDEVRARLPRQAGAGLVFDFAAVELINFIGITCLLQVDEQSRKNGATMYLAQLPGPIGQFLKQLKLDRKFTQAATVDDAVAVLDLATR